MKKIKRKSKIEEICCRKQSQSLMALLLPVVVVGGYFYPMLGFIVLSLITIFMVIASQRGRFYRGWLCPMGSIQGVSSKNTYILTVEDSCIECKKCRRICPISTYPGKYKQETGTGTVPSMDCLRCSNCIDNCPKDSLYFSS